MFLGSLEKKLTIYISSYNNMGALMSMSASLHKFIPSLGWILKHLSALLNLFEKKIRL